MCRITVIFGTLRNRSLLINILASKIITETEVRRCKSNFDFRRRAFLSMIELRFTASNLGSGNQISIFGVEPRCRSSKFDFRRQTSVSIVELRFPASNLGFDRKTSISGVEPRCRWSNFDFQRQTSVSMVELRLSASSLVVDRNWRISYAIDAFSLRKWRLSLRNWRIFGSIDAWLSTSFIIQSSEEPKIVSLINYFDVPRFWKCLPSLIIQHVPAKNQTCFPSLIIQTPPEFSKIHTPGKTIIWFQILTRLSIPI